MKSVYLKALCLTVLLVIVFSLVPIGRTQGGAQDTELSFLVQNHPDGDKTYELNVTIPYSLYQYYNQQSHFLFSPQDFPKFITPYTLKPIADRLWQIYNNTEDFTNGVLMLVHQITYEEIAASKYPVETLVDGKGDCDLFVYIAASILEAGGVPVVLLYYKDKLHMELGVDLGSPPTDARFQVYSVNSSDVPYYIAESTGGKWRQGWRIGECPTDYQNATSQVIVPTNMEQTSIGQVAANLRELDPSTLTMHLSSPLILQNSELVISGQVLPQTSNENVTLRGRTNSGGWYDIGTVATGSDGSFSYSWLPSQGGFIEVQASWVGNRQLNGASSGLGNVVLVPFFVVMLVLTAVLLAVFVSLAVVLMRRKHKTSSTAIPPPEPVMPQNPP
jgi:hypothetical protein